MICGSQVTTGPYICRRVVMLETITIIAESDTKIRDDGTLVMKRKYGKFTRPVYQYNVKKGESIVHQIGFKIYKPIKSCLKKYQ